MMKKNHEERHKGKHKTEARIKIYCVLMGVISFLLCFAAGSLILRYMEKEQKDMAMYTAKITASRLEMQLEKYVQILRVRKRFSLCVTAPLICAFML
uniref:hypothetical protein n=1 Tax=Dialister sp. TaxID=1955814 RepID=UPI003FEEFB18